MAKYVYLFSEGDASMRNLLGGKGANLAEMTKLGLPVPQGFTVSTEACTRYYDDGKVIAREIEDQILEALGKLEEITGKKFGDKENPLLVSVRSGARASMPGMMDTILNLGLNEEVVKTMAANSGNERWAWDCYRRFIQMFSDVVMEVGKKYFEQLIDKMKEEKGVTQDVELTADDLKVLAAQFKAEYKEKLGEDFPDDPKVQLLEAVKAVFGSEGEKGSDGKMQNKQRGNVLMSDIIQEAAVSPKILNHVSIDRFTGGAIDGALFSEETLYAKGLSFDLKLIVNNNAFEDKDVKTAFEDSLKDLCSGMLPLGGGVNRGNGCFEGTIKRNGELIYGNN